MELLKKASEILTWSTKQGTSLRLCEMSTQHTFHVLRMLFNNSAHQFRMTPVMFVTSNSLVTRMDLKLLARSITILCYEIKERNNLPTRYQEPFQQILNQIISNDSFMLMAWSEKKSEVKDALLTSQNEHEDRLTQSKRRIHLTGDEHRL
jgi:hypothetical protein